MIVIYCHDTSTIDIVESTETFYKKYPFDDFISSTEIKNWNTCDCLKLSLTKGNGKTEFKLQNNSSFENEVCQYYSEFNIQQNDINVEHNVQYCEDCKIVSKTYSYNEFNTFSFYEIKI